jgi:hypothetical protein
VRAWWISGSTPELAGATVAVAVPGDGTPPLGGDDVLLAVKYCPTHAFSIQEED